MSEQDGSTIQIDWMGLHDGASLDECLAWLDAHGLEYELDRDPEGVSLVVGHGELSLSSLPDDQEPPRLINVITPNQRRLRALFY